MKARWIGAGAVSIEPSPSSVVTVTRLALDQQQPAVHAGQHRLAVGRSPWQAPHWPSPPAELGGIERENRRAAHTAAACPARRSDLGDFPPIDPSMSSWLVSLACIAEAFSDPR